MPTWKAELVALPGRSESSETAVRSICNTGPIAISISMHHTYADSRRHPLPGGVKVCSGIIQDESRFVLGIVRPAAYGSKEKHAQGSSVWCFTYGNSRGEPPGSLRIRSGGLR